MVVELRGVAIALVVVFATLAVANGATIHVNETGWWFEGGSFNASDNPIQSAVNNASDGDLILIEPGRYYENVDVVDKAVSLIGNGKPDDVIVEAISNDATFYIKDTRDLSGIMNAEVTLKNLTVIRKPGYFGVHVDDFYGYSGTWNKNVSIENVSIISASVTGTGIEIENSTYVTVSGAYINKGNKGIEITDGSGNVVIEHCRIDGSTHTIYVTGDSQASIRYNELVGGTLKMYYNDMFVWVGYNSFNNSGTDEDCLLIHGSSNFVIENNEFVVGSGTAIHLTWNPSSGNILRNTITGDGEGIGIYVSGNNIYLDSNVVENLAKGIYLSSSQSVTLYNNTMNANAYNFGVYDTYRPRLLTITVYPNNLADGKPIYYYVGERDLVIPNDASTAYCIDCVNVSAVNLNLRNNIHGLFFYNCSNVEISNVTTRYVRRGIDVYDSHNVSILNSSINFSAPYVSPYLTGSGTSVTIRNSDKVLIYNTSMIDEPDTGLRVGLGIYDSSEVAVVDSELVCHSRPYVGKGIEVANSQYLHFENFYADASESSISANNYELLNCRISGVLHIYGSYAQILNCELGDLGVGALNVEVKDCSLTSAYLWGQYIKFENNAIAGSYDGLRIGTTGKYCYVANNTISGGGSYRGLAVSGSGNVFYNNVVSGFDTGIYLATTNNTFIANRIENCGYGIHISASDLEDYFNNIDSTNTINGKPVLYLVNESDKIYTGSYSFVGIVNCTNVSLNVYSTEPNYHGVVIAYSNDSSVTINDVNSLSYYAVYLDHANRNTISLSATGLADGYGVYARYSNDNDLDVSVSGYKNGVWLENSDGNTITGTISNCRYDGIRIDDSDDNTVTNALVSNCHYGVRITNYADFNTIENSKIVSNVYGLHLWSSDNNTVTGNYILNNNYGVSLGHSDDNLIYDNYFSNTNWNARTSYSTNIWNVSKQSGTNILGGNYLGGNYWSDYTGSDSDGDGFGDDPYHIDASNIDYLPLVSTYHEIEILVLAAPLVNQSTLGILKVRFVNFSAGDPYSITIYDPANTIVYQTSGTLVSDNVTVDIDWTPQTTGNHTIEAYAQGTINSVTVNVYQYAIVAPIPEVTTLVLFSIGVAGLILTRKIR